MGETKIFVFEFTNTSGSKKEYQFPAYSLQMAWIAAASYAACHILNPAVETIRYVKQIREDDPKKLSKLIANPA